MVPCTPFFDFYVRTFTGWFGRSGGLCTSASPGVPCCAKVRKREDSSPQRSFGSQPLALSATLPSRRARKRTWVAATPSFAPSKWPFRRRRQPSGEPPCQCRPASGPPSCPSTPRLHFGTRSRPGESKEKHVNNGL